MTRPILGRALIAAAAAAAAASAGVCRAATPLSNPELDAVRGGFVTAGGITFGFGADETTFVNGQQVLRTTLTLGANGALASQSTSAQTALSNLDPALAARLGLPGAKGVSLDGGAVTLVQGLSANQLLNLLINSASNQVIRQNTAINITLPNFSQLQQSSTTAQTASGLMSALNAASLGALAH